MTTHRSDTDATLTRLQASPNGDWKEHKMYVVETLKAHNRDINAIFDRLRSMEIRIAAYIGGGVVILWAVERYW